jgi:hypothetical protein
MCPRCPVSVHLHSRCSGVHNAKDFMCCTHHRCSGCDKNTDAAGGLLFACESCPNAYCEDCRPDDSLPVGDSGRFQTLGFTTSRTIYIHCSKMCIHYAKTESGWTEPSRVKNPSPPALNVSDHFGAKVEEALEENPEQTATRLRARRKKVNYADTPEAPRPAIVNKENMVPLYNSRSSPATMKPAPINRVPGGVIGLANMPTGFTSLAVSSVNRPAPPVTMKSAGIASLPVSFVSRSAPPASADNRPAPPVTMKSAGIARLAASAFFRPPPATMQPAATSLVPGPGGVADLTSPPKGSATLRVTL